MQQIKYHEAKMEHRNSDSINQQELMAPSTVMRNVEAAATLKADER